LQRDARQVIRDVVAPVTSKGGPAKAEALATLALAVLNGLSVTEYLEGEEAKVQEAYTTFLELLRASFDS
jgi:hypothetical protein